MGANIVVEFAKESRPRRDVYEAEQRPRTRRPPGYRLIVSGISRDTSWQDLKDFGREAGSVSYADIDRDVPGEGVLEYLSREDAERAVKELDGRDLRGQPVRVALDAERGGPDNYRRDARRDDRPRDDRYGRDDRHRDDRHRDDRYREDRSFRRERSRSPRREDPDRPDRRPARSPPPRREYDDKRPAAGDDVDRRRDDRRRDEKDERFEDRPPRHANGDNGWAR
ncbi:hypothetical protein CERSUDRAFT_82463 [Gelatoporia subvermispora B]|uniref:RRM domain-containing protein n=1 Tax=Ceriporiopsis subvermispora (strain B) TaxID=914234 RepID=M2RIA9_CERS8|nr:hypothetical protein CERSUDRAFT_82463 [Gelatoporia subvermispora B]